MAMYVLPSGGSSAATANNNPYAGMTGFAGAPLVSPGRTGSNTSNPGYDNSFGYKVNSVPTVDPNTVSADPTGEAQAEWEYQKQLDLLAKQREYNSAEAEKNRQWQEYMSNTAIQRQVKDLEAAGLNKWLALNGGSAGGASTPSGSAATSSAGDASAPNPSLLRAIYQFSAAITTSVIRLFDFF